MEDLKWDPVHLDYRPFILADEIVTHRRMGRLATYSITKSSVSGRDGGGGGGGGGSGSGRSGGGGGSFEGPGNASILPEEDVYYHLLGLKPGASLASEESIAAIKTAYQNCHPDRFPDDTAAANKFRAVQAPCRVLRDPFRKAEYDENGSVFVPLVGSLKLMAAKDVECAGNADEAVLRQREREVTCALNLLEIIDPFVSEAQNAAAFEANITVLAKELDLASFGEELLHAIGFVYHTEGREQLGRIESTGGLKGHGLSAWRKCHIVGAFAATLAARVKSQLVGGMSHATVDVLVRETGLEVGVTLRSAFHKLLHDKGIKAAAVTKKRAKALFIVGAVFLGITHQAGRVHSWVESDFVRRVAAEAATCCSAHPTSPTQEEDDPASNSDIKGHVAPCSNSDNKEGK